MNKKALSFIITIISIIVILTIISAIFYYSFKKESSGETNTSQDSSYKVASSKKTRMFQDILDKYSVCIQNKDIDCTCNYLIASHCDRLRNTGFGSEASHAPNGELIGDGKIVELGTEGNQISGLDPEIYKKAASFLFVAKSNEYAGLCLSITFVEENGKWKAFDVDGPIPESYCEE